MGSTASSAVDLPTLVARDTSAPIHGAKQPTQPGPRDPNGHTVSSPASVTVLSEDAFPPAKKEHLLSSSPLDKAPHLTDPLLADADEHPAALGSVESLTDSIHLEINRLAPSPTSEDNSGPAACLGSSTPTIPETVPASLLICTMPTLEPPPSSTLDSPDLQDKDVNEIATNSGPPLLEGTLSSLVEFPSMHDDRPLFPVASPAPESDSDVLTHPPPPHITPQTASSPQFQKADKFAFTPSKTDSQPPHLDLAPTSDKESSTHPSTPCSSLKLTPPRPADSDHMSTDATSPAVLLVTDIVPDSAVTLVSDSINSSVDSGRAAASPPSHIDCTVSSPIDSGVLPVSDRETVSIDSGTVDGTDST